MDVLDLFSGIGGFSLGLERCGHKTICFCEYDDHAQSILKKHWPETQIIKDVKDVGKDTITKSPSIITGGFPCQDLSSAGKQAGIEKGERSGLWGEMHRIISEFRPRYVIVENVPNLLRGERGSWFSKLLKDLAAIGYDAQWHCISVADIGGATERERVWIVAYPAQVGWALSQEIYNKISNKVRACRTPSKVLSLLSCVKQVQFEEILPDHRKLDGLSEAVDTCERIGNTIHPKIAQIIGESINESDHLFCEK